MGKLCVVFPLLYTQDAPHVKGHQIFQLSVFLLSQTMSYLFFFQLKIRWLIWLHGGTNMAETLEKSQRSSRILLRFFWRDKHSGWRLSSDLAHGWTKSEDCIWTYKHFIWKLVRDTSYFKRCILWFTFTLIYIIKELFITVLLMY